MLRKVLGTCMENMKRFFAIWLTILIVNQLLIFGACFAPYCLVAALPHTLVIALLTNYLFFRNDQSASHPLCAPSKQSETTALHVKLTPESFRQKSFEKVPPRIGSQVLKVLVLVTVIGLALLAVLGSSRKSGPTSIATSETRRFEILSAGGEQGRALTEESPTEDNSHSGPPSQNLSLHIDQGGDEFDDNDIETYERLTQQKYVGSTRHQQYGMQEMSLNNAGLGENTKTAQPGKSGNKPEISASTPLPYRCTTATGKVGIGTGRMSYENEYSSFLKREVHADEFVIFRYQGSGKEYWFKVLNCVPI